MLLQWQLFTLQVHIFSKYRFFIPKKILNTLFLITWSQFKVVMQIKIHLKTNLYMYKGYPESNRRFGLALGEGRASTTILVFEYSVTQYTSGHSLMRFLWCFLCSMFCNF